MEKPETTLMMDIIISSCLPEGLNELVICLLLKFNALSTLNPISLCNVLIKGVSKILVNLI